MKFFNITVQRPLSQQRQAIHKEYILSLENSINSLYEYLHYYNPEWRLLGYNENSNNTYTFIKKDDTVITEDSIINENENDAIDIYKLFFRWGFKNRTTHVYQYGADYSETLNIGASIYKKDAYDLESRWFIKDIIDLPINNGGCIWTYDNNTYYLNGSNSYMFDKTTSKWIVKEWAIEGGGTLQGQGYNIWTDGKDTYFSSGTYQYKLDSADLTWKEKTWIGLNGINLYGEYIWTDGENIYYSRNSTQKVLDRSTSTWSNKTWDGLINFSGNFIWKDEDNIYYSFNSTQYILDKSTSTWSEKIWNGLVSFSGNNVWTDGENIYYSLNTEQYVLNRKSNTWYTKYWKNSPALYGLAVWIDEENNINYFDRYTQYQLDKNSIPSVSHFMIFESALAQYYNWNFIGGFDKDGDPVIIYNCFPCDELDFGLSYAIQIAVMAPRYYYHSQNSGYDYKIKYKNDAFESGTIFDYNNINLQVKQNGVFIPQNEPDSPRYQRWQGNSSIVTQPVFKDSDDNSYEDLIADVITYQRPAQESEFQVRLNWNREESTPIIEKNFEIIFS